MSLTWEPFYPAPREGRFTDCPLEMESVEDEDEEEDEEDDDDYSTSS